MATFEDAKRAWTSVFKAKQDVSPFRFALSGDGTNAATADVVGKPGWAWVRYDEKQMKVSQVRNRRYPSIPQEVPVVIGKLFPFDKEVEILVVNWPLYDQALDEGDVNEYLVAKHGDSHNAVYGADPAYMDLRNLMPGRVRPTIPAGLSVYTEALAYERMGTYYLWLGGDIDLSSDVPGIANRHRYVLVTLDTHEQELDRRAGAVTPVAIGADVPDVPIWHMPLAAVLLEDGQTTIVDADIYDYRILFSDIGHQKTDVNLTQYIHLMDEILTTHLEGVL